MSCHRYEDFSHDFWHQVEKHFDQFSGELFCQAEIKDSGENTICTYNLNISQSRLAKSGEGPLSNPAIQG